MDTKDTKRNFLACVLSRSHSISEKKSRNWDGPSLDLAIVKTSMRLRTGTSRDVRGRRPHGRFRHHREVAAVPDVAEHRREDVLGSHHDAQHPRHLLLDDEQPLVGDALVGDFRDAVFDFGDGIAHRGDHALARRKPGRCVELLALPQPAKQHQYQRQRRALAADRRIPDQRDEQAAVVLRRLYGAVAIPADDIADRAARPKPMTLPPATVGAEVGGHSTALSTILRSASPSEFLPSRVLYRPALPA